MFRAGRVSTSQLTAIALRARDSAVTYDDVGATLTDRRPAGLRRDRREIVLARRPDAFDRAAAGLRGWAAHLGAGLTVAPLDPPSQGATVAVAAPLGPLTAVAVCRVVAVVDEPDRYGFAYGTLPGHPERGEEAFLVEREDDRVVFSVVALSAPVELLARLGGPVTRAIQRSTTRRYLSALAQFVDAAR